MSALDRLDLEDNKVLRGRSLYKMNEMVEKRRQGVALGYGEYMEIYVLKVFFSVVKASDRIVCQFYYENWPFKTVITGNHSTADGLATFNSVIFAVVGQGFVAVNITFWNTAGAANHQAVAMRSREDTSTFYSYSFEGYQDTLYPHSNRKFYTECDIYGTVDFIFGNGAAVLQDCNIYPLYVLQVIKERVNNRVDDLQGMFCDLQSAGKESRTNDVALLEEQVNRMLGEWQSVLNHPSPASSF
ncbi:hypothetical protein AgCh_015607 [Apium graveolens]